MSRLEAIELNMERSYFYLSYPQIGATVSHQFETNPEVLVSNLSFSHIREMMQWQ